uniref:ADP-ribosyl cyclase/cyclic ADP-ribose hydrolase n=1 Tax=Arabidopsis thaliana TaxID=3702 RepID=A0A866WN42_ARATH|nr:DM10 [Arabidopsis thaliana]QOE89130.1 DM10 [Arabidopsis thaliana]
MASSSSSSRSRTWRYRVFTNFHGPDVRKTFLSHLRKQFSYNGISMFDDQSIERSQTIVPALTGAIKESRISIVVLSKNYASSRWCLDELLEILKCREDIGQIVMTVFYGVDPSDVRKQTGEFGIAFNKTCEGKTNEETQKWSKALNDVGNIAGEHFFNWDNEAKMIEKIARDVSNKLNATISWDFEDMVGIEAHLEKMQSLLNLDYEDGAMIVGIYGPAGIGKTTIARALHSRLSSSFQLTCFMENIRGSYNSGLDEYGLKLRLQEQLLSKVLNQDGIRINHLGAIPERLCDQKVLIILDDVDDLQQLEALANETNWFGPGSRIIVTTEDQELLEQHDVNKKYHVDFPTREEACKIFCTYAFRRSFAPYGFEKLAERVTWLCSNLPLGLRVMGSTLRGKKEDDWEGILCRLENSLDRKIDGVLRVGYDHLCEDDQFLYLLIAFFFNYVDDDHVKAMLVEDNLDIKLGLKTLAYKSLIQISAEGNIVMHKLLQRVGREAIQRQEPTKRRILIDAREICDVLRYGKGTSNVSGISFDTSDISEVTISDDAFKRLHDLRFLKVTKSRYDGKYRMHIPAEIEFPCLLRLLHWEAFPSKCLPPTFNPEFLVELNMQDSQLEHLWRGTQSLRNLKNMDLRGSTNLKELPDLTNATNLEDLNLNSCESLVEIPSSFSHLHKLKNLWMSYCINLQVIPAHMNLVSLERVTLTGCSRLRNIPVISTHISYLDISKTTELEYVSASIALWCRLGSLDMSYNENFMGLTHLPMSLTQLILRYSDIERIPDCIKALHQLFSLDLTGCRRLASLPELPGSLLDLEAEDCESLETVFSPLHTPRAHLYFTNCFKLGGQARRAIIRRRSEFIGMSLLPGREVPAEFDHRAKGNSLTIILNGNRPSYDYTQYMVCVVISTNQEITKIRNFSSTLLCHINGYIFPDYKKVYIIGDVSKCRREHLFIFHTSYHLHIDPSGASREIVFEFRSKFKDFDIIECGVKIWTAQSIKREYLVFEDDNDIKHDDHTNRVNGPYKASNVDYKSVSRKRPRKPDLKLEIQRRRF